MPEPRRADEAVDDYVVWMSLPAQPRSVRPARALAAALAVELGFDVDDLDDLRVAVQEAFALLLPTAVGQIDLRVTPRVDHLEIELVAESSVPLGDGSSLARQLLEVLVADHHASTEGGRHRIWLRSHPPGDGSDG